MARDPLLNESDVQVPVTVTDTNPIRTLPQIVSVTRTAGVWSAMFVTFP